MMILHSSLLCPLPNSSVLHSSLLCPLPNFSVLHGSLLCLAPSPAPFTSLNLAPSPAPFTSLTLAPSRLSFFPVVQAARQSQREQPVIKSRPYKEPEKTEDRCLVVVLTSYHEKLDRAGAVVPEFSRSNTGSRFYCGISMTGALEKPAPTANEGKKRGKKEAGKKEAAVEKSKLQVLNDLLMLGMVLAFIRRHLQFSSLHIIGSSSEVARLLSVKEIVGEKKNERRKNEKNRKPVEKEDEKFQKIKKELVHMLKSGKYQLSVVHGCYGGAGYFRRCHFFGIQQYNKWVRGEEARKEEARKGVRKEGPEVKATFIKALMPTGIQILLWPSSVVSPATKRKVVKDWKKVIASGVLKA